MRRNPIILQTAAPALLVLCLVSSCCRSEASIDEEDAILIGVAQAGTRAIIDDEDGTDRIKNMIGQCYNGTAGSKRKNDAGFGVYGYKRARNGDDMKIFDNVLVYPEHDSRPENNVIANSKWTYAHPRYWDQNGSYQFIAYWPWVSVDGTGTIVEDHYTNNANDPLNKTLYLRNVPNWQPVNGDEKDFMTAVKTGTYDPDFKTTKTVHLSFYHILSQLEIRAYYVGSDKESQGGVRIKKILLSESSDGESDVLYGSDATKTGESTGFKQRYDDAQASVIDTTLDLAHSYMLMDNSTGVLIPFKDELAEKYYMWNPSLTPSGGKELVDGPVTVGRWLMIPHTWNGINISVRYNVGNAEDDVNKDIEDESSYSLNIPKTPVTIGEANYNYKTQPGKRYIVTLLFDTTGGGLSVKQIIVQEWDVYEVSREVYNW